MRDRIQVMLFGWCMSWSYLRVNIKRDDGDAKKSIEEEKIERPASRASTKSKATTVASSIKREPVPLTGFHLRDAVTYLIRYLTDKRQKLARKLNDPSVKSPKSDSVDNQSLLDQASLVDTTLLKSYMMTNDALVGPLLRVQNHCDVEECETILMEKRKYKELVDLYNCKGLHGRALDLLQKLGNQQDGPLRGVLPTIRYLQRLGIEHFELVLEYSRWVLEKDPKHGMDIFIDDLEKTETFPRDKVLRHLESISSDLVIQYLEFIIQELHDESPEFHNRLVIVYLDKINSDKKKNGKHDS
ncbi:hypothetical protein RMATCC62417_12051 [Rhizopus microsporus]|nr:hypothetical protein RMATCC62417_12051 [Rhizopus microsporus]